MSSIYLADKPRISHAKTGEACKVVRFPRQVEATLENVIQYCFGPDGDNGCPTSYCQTTIHFKDGYRSQSNFLEADVIPLDIDGDPVEGDNPADWQSKYKPILEKIGLHSFAYPSLSRRCHVFVPLSRSVTSMEDYRAVVKATLQALKAKFPELEDDLDPADKDAARMLFEGAAVVNPGEWAFEIPGEPLNVDDALEYAAHGPIENKAAAHSLNDLTDALESEGDRNNSAYKLALYAKAHSKSKEEAYAAYLFMVQNTTLDRAEVDSIFESAMKADVPLGSDLEKQGNEKPNKAVAREEELGKAFKAVEARLRAKFRRAVQNPADEGGQPARLKSNEIYAIHENKPGSGKGYATLVTREGYKKAVFDMIEEYAAGNEALEMRMKNKSAQMLNPDCLSSDGLKIPCANEAFFRNGIFKIYGYEGRKGKDFEFVPLREGEYLISPYPWDFEPNSELLWKGIVDWLNLYFPPQTEETLISFEGAIFLDMVCSAVGRIVNDEFCLWVQGKGGNGKTTGVRDQFGVALGGEPVFRNMAGKTSFFMGFENPFDGTLTQDAAIAYYDEIPLSERINAERFKRFISKGDLTMEVKFGSKWNEEKLFKVLFTANDLPQFSSYADNGLTRKLRVIKAIPDLLHAGLPIPPVKEVIPIIRALICAALQMPSLSLLKYRPLWEEYPLRKQWLRKGNESAIWEDLLIPADNPEDYVSISEIRRFLKGAKEGISKLGPDKIAAMVRDAGYPVKERSHRAPLRVQGYLINDSSDLAKSARNDYESTHSNTAYDNPKFDHFPLNAETREEYAAKYEDLLADYCSYLQAMLPADVVPSAVTTESSCMVDNPAPADDFETTYEPPAAMSEGLNPAFSPLEARPKGGNGEAREEFYAELRPWLKENGCLSNEPLSVKGARWCGKEYGRNYNHMLSFNLKDIVQDLLPAFAYTYFQKTGPYPADVVTIRRGKYEPGSLEDRVSRAFFEGFNEGVKLQE